MEFVIVSLHPHLKPDGYYKGKTIRKGKRLPVFSTDRSCAAVYQSYVKADRIRQMILDLREEMENAPAGGNRTGAGENK